MNIFHYSLNEKKKKTSFSLESFSFEIFRFLFDTTYLDNHSYKNVVLAATFLAFLVFIWIKSRWLNSAKSHWIRTLEVKRDTFSCYLLSILNDFFIFLSFCLTYRIFSFFLSVFLSFFLSFWHITCFLPILFLSFQIPSFLSLDVLNFAFLLSVLLSYLFDILNFFLSFFLSDKLNYSSFSSILCSCLRFFLSFFLSPQSYLHFFLSFFLSYQSRSKVIDHLWRNENQYLFMWTFMYM